MQFSKRSLGWAVHYCHTLQLQPLALLDTLNLLHAAHYLELHHLQELLEDDLSRRIDPTSWSDLYDAALATRAHRLARQCLAYASRFGQLLPQRQLAQRGLTSQEGFRRVCVELAPPVEPGPLFGHLKRFPPDIMVSGGAGQTLAFHSLVLSSLFPQGHEKIPPTLLHLIHEWVYEGTVSCQPTAEEWLGIFDLLKGSPAYEPLMRYAALLTDRPPDDSDDSLEPRALSIRGPVSLETWQDRLAQLNYLFLAHQPSSELLVSLLKQCPVLEELHLPQTNLLDFPKSALPLRCRVLHCSGPFDCGSLSLALPSLESLQCGQIHNSIELTWLPRLRRLHVDRMSTLAFQTCMAECTALEQLSCVQRPKLHRRALEVMAPRLWRLHTVDFTSAWLDAVSPNCPLRHLEFTAPTRCTESGWQRAAPHLSKLQTLKFAANDPVTPQTVEHLLINCPSLRQIQLPNSLSDAIPSWALKFPKITFTTHQETQ